MDPTPPVRLLRGTELRYMLTRMLQLGGPSTVAELAAELERFGFGVSGRPSKTISDALRWEIRRDRVRRRGRGMYQQGAVPRSTSYRIIRRVIALHDEVLSLRGEHRPLFPD
ncbi:MAG: hypothetical protein FGM50_11885 [Mycobacterium sp.]|nr:hypothetical protein [Mycobacterium sp.]